MTLEMGDNFPFYVNKMKNLYDTAGNINHINWNLLHMMHSVTLHSEYDFFFSHALMQFIYVNVHRFMQDNHVFMDVVWYTSTFCPLTVCVLFPSLCTMHMYIYLCKSIVTFIHFKIQAYKRADE